MAITNAGSTSLSFTSFTIGIQVTKITDTSSDWSGISNSTYFYDKADGLVHYKDSSGTILELFSSSGSAGLTYFSETGVTTSPNATVPVVGFVASSAATNIDVAIIPKGSGALLGSVPNNTTATGNKRGQNAVDWQTAGRISVDQVASGNYSVISGGRANKASGTESICAGGYYNVASGDQSVVLGGEQNTASSTKAAVLGGAFNTASASFTSVGGGNSNQATGYASTVPGGYGNVASGNYTAAIGGTYNTSSADYAITYGHSNVANATYSVAFGTNASTLGIKNRIAISAGQFAAAGDAQISKFILKVLTTNNTATDITTDGGAYANGTNNYIALSNQSAFRFKGTIIGKQSGTTDAAVWDIDGFIVRGANAAATTLNIGNVTLVQNTPGWGTPTLAADTTIGCLQVRVIGASATNIRWVANIETTEVIYA